MIAACASARAAARALRGHGIAELVGQLLDDHCPQARAVPADGERMPVSELLRQMENGDARDVCVYSPMSWR